MRSIICPGGLFALLLLASCPAAASASTVYQQWPNGPSSADDFFPIGVSFQSVYLANQYRAIGVNTYIHIDTNLSVPATLQRLAQAGMKIIPPPSAAWLAQKSHSTIVGWEQEWDEPDNAQPNGSGGYGPPVDPLVLHAMYDQVKAQDATRPIFLNFGQGVGWDRWYGRGVRTNHPEDYPQYINGGSPIGDSGGDLISFDIYPAASEDSVIRGQLWRVAYGVQRLANWSRPDQPVWNYIETTDISGRGFKPTPTQVRAEVWMSIIHGSKGIVYFAHQINNPFNADALLDDSMMATAVTSINQQVQDLAPVINSQTVLGRAQLTSLTANQPFNDVEVPIGRLGSVAKIHDGSLYLFAVGMRSVAMQAEFTMARLGDVAAEVIGENRTVPISAGVLADAFSGYEAHLYRIPLPGAAIGDFNVDGLVDGNDLTAWGQAFGAGAGADADGDGDSDGGDFLVWQRYASSSTTATVRPLTTLVPEPQAFLTAAAPAMFLVQLIAGGSNARSRGVNRSFRSPSP